MRLLTRTALLGVSLIAVLTCLTLPAFAAESSATTATKEATASTGAKSGSAPKSSSAPTEYDMDFTLPTIGKSGCMVCHGDANLVRQKGGQSKSYYLDPEMMEGSAHRDVQCTGCHVDFAYKAPHKVKGDWRASAKLSCKNCHQDQFLAYSGGVHGPKKLETASKKTGAKADIPKPLCGDCHGAHDIKILTQEGAELLKVEYDPTGREELHGKAAEVCGRCHEDYYDSYDDYYHGAAYKKGAPDAPACWQCHGSHAIYPAADRRSDVNEQRLVDTCGQCHAGSGKLTHVADVTDGYVSFANMIHRRKLVEEDNALNAILGSVKEAVSGIFESVVSLFS